MRPELIFSEMERSVAFDGQTYYLPEGEFVVARLFFEEGACVVTVEQMRRALEARRFSPSDSSVRSVALRLRHRLELLTDSQFTVECVYKLGYRLREGFDSLGAYAVPQVLRVA